MATRLEGNRLILEGAVNAQTVPALLAAGGDYLGRGLTVVDFAAVGEVDSSAIALALEWLRDARAASLPLEFANLPPSMSNLARLYGVTDFLQPQA